MVGSLIPTILDTTLRDGEQTPGLVFSLKEKVRILELLDTIGIPEVEVGIPAIGQRDVEDIKYLTRLGLKPSLLGWARNHVEDFRAVRKANLERIHVSFVSSPILMEVFEVTQSSLLEQVKEVIRTLKGDFEFVSVGFQDLARGEKSFLMELVSVAIEEGAKRARLADTLGLMNPLQVKEFFDNLCHKVDGKKLEFHAHNDLGLACANSIMAILSGVGTVDVTLNGLGERAGNAALEEVVMALDRSTSLNISFNKSLFYEASQLICTARGEANHSQKPVVGSKVFLHESGIHTRGMCRSSESYEPFSNREVGCPQGGFLFGKHSGSYALNEFLKSKGYSLNRNETRKLLREVKGLSFQRKRALNGNEVLALFDENLRSM